MFVIVEGPSDDEALGVILERLYDKNEVHVEITHGDITSDIKTYATNIVSKIGDLVKKFAVSTHYNASDFQQVIHLIDMDGAYIPERAVVRDEKYETPFYSTTEIRTANSAGILRRNSRKRENIDRICLHGKVWNSIPYRAYYMSANLDHVLYDRLNSTDEDKKRDALAFARKYRERLDEFLAFISDSDFSVQGNFKDSWEYIKKENHSLERHTNLGLCFIDIREKRTTMDLNIRK